MRTYDIQRSVIEMVRPYALHNLLRTTVHWQGSRNLESKKFKEDDPTPFVGCGQPSVRVDGVGWPLHHDREHNLIFCMRRR
jgi:hypothetical protein